MVKKIFLVCGELSGDLHASRLLAELYKIIPKEMLTVKVIGSSNLKDVGADIFFDSSYLGAVGLTEVLRNISLYVNLEKELLCELNIFRPDVLILVDFPGFNLRIVKNVKKNFPDMKVAYYLPPQLWAWNEGRAKILADYCDLVLSGLPFEEDFLRKRKVNAIYVGNPILGELENINRDKARIELGVEENEKLIGIFPGSRQSEIHYMLPVLLKGSKMLQNDFPSIKFKIAQALNIELRAGSWEVGKIEVLSPENNHKLLCASDIVWLTSGTVTLEAALYETPMILGYRGNWINYFLYLLVRRINMIGLPNIIVEKKLVPELVQRDACAENFYKLTKGWLQNPAKLIEIRNNLSKVKEKLGSKNASQEAAAKIRNELIPEYKVFVMK